MKTLVIYDNEGYVISSITGSESLLRIPKGIPSILTEIPTGKQVKFNDGVGVDVSKYPHELILEDTPKNETEIIKDDLTETKQAIAELTMLVSMNMSN